jgi:uncharacterized protein YfdQ (DUF2303 family)
MENNHINDTQTAYLAGLVASEVRTVGSNPYAVIPEGAELHDLEKMLPNPTRKRGNVVLRDTASFVAFVNMQKTAQTLIFGNKTTPGFVAVFNGDAVEQPGWGDYKAAYSCPTSVEWQTWNSMNGKQLGQEQFAQFIENNLPDMVQPPAAEMLEISRSLEAKKKVNFASSVRLANGENELTYEEQISGTAAKGKLKVPEEFQIGIPVLEGGLMYAVKARLRYRIQDGGKLVIWYELIRPHKIIEDAVNTVWNEIEQKVGQSILNGSP